MRCSLLLSLLTSIPSIYSVDVDSSASIRNTTATNLPANGASNATQIIPSYHSNSTLQTNDISCNGIEYGWELSEESCISAMQRIPRNHQTFTTGHRRTGNFDLLLPHRVLSRKPSTWGLGETDAHCALKKWMASAPSQSRAIT